MSTHRKLSVRWSIWRITVDEDILRQFAPSTWEAITTGGQVEPEIKAQDIDRTIPRTCMAFDGTQYQTVPAVDIANRLMNAQQERVNTHWYQPKAKTRLV